MVAIQKGKGERFLDCPKYEECLNFAGVQNWHSFNCESCPVFKEQIKGEKPEEKNVRICEECGKRPTINPKNPYCPVCLGIRGHKKQLEKALPTGEAKKPQEGPAETLKVDISVTIPKELFRLIFSSK